MELPEAVTFLICPHRSSPAWSETVLKITITPRTPDDMRVFYSFTDAQNQALDALLANG